jgi:hypothetical protein
MEKKGKKNIIINNKFEFYKKVENQNYTSSVINNNNINCMSFSNNVNIQN